MSDEARCCYGPSPMQDALIAIEERGEKPSLDFAPHLREIEMSYRRHLDGLDVADFIRQQADEIDKLGGDLRKLGFHFYKSILSCTYPSQGGRAMGRAE